MHAIPRALVHGRFQPPHNGHLRYFLLALEKAEHVVIGICTPEICTKEYAEATGYPCTQELNPYSYDDRAAMIAATLTDEGIASDRYSFVPLSSDYSTIEALVPKDIIFFMSTTDNADNTKIAHLAALGYDVQTILSVPASDRTEKAGDIRQAHDGWEQQVPRAVAKYLTDRERSS